MTVTLTKARRDLMGALGPYQIITSGVQRVPPSGTYFGIASGADAARTVVSSDIADLDYQGTGADTDANWWNGGFAYLLNTVPEQRRIARGSYSPNNDAAVITDQTSSGFYAGAFTLNRPMATAVATGIQVELSAVLPPLNWDRGEGLHACINRALMSIPMEYSVSITGAGTKLVDLSTTIPWLYRKDQYIGCYDKAPDADTLGIPHPGGVGFEFNGNTVQLVSDSVFPTGDTFTLKLWRPVGTWIKVGSTWATSTVGLVNETDEAFIDPKVLEVCATYYAYKALAMIHKGVGQGEHFRQLMMEQAAIAAPFLMFDTDFGTDERPRGTGWSSGYPVIGYPSSDSDGGGSWP